MKKIILLFAVLLIAESSFSQQKNSKPELTKHDYLKKGKRQRITSGVLFGGGLLLIYSAVEISDGKSSTDFNSIISASLALSGMAAVVTSIPVFIISFATKSKGMRMSFNNQTIPYLQTSSFVYKAIPSLNIKINL